MEHSSVGSASPPRCGPLMLSLGYPRVAQGAVVPGVPCDAMGWGGRIATTLRTLDVIVGLPASLSGGGRAGGGRGVWESG